MTDINFARDGRVGDDVWHPEFGNGVIVRIIQFINVTHPVCVKFYPYQDKNVSFRSDGSLYVGGPALLCWGHRGPLDRGKPPEREPKPLEFKGVPVWAYVGDNVRDYWMNKDRSRVVAVTGRQQGARFIAIGGEKDEFSGEYTITWNYAWEIPEGEGE